ncbi:MAG TPA: glycosyltransferase [Micromonosporaceae bacterium]|nr:glycosyltransferase [Micromonosporaceae bacterium]
MPASCATPSSFSAGPDAVPVLSIGVAARNEEATIARTLQSIDQALAALPEPTPAEVIVAVNGTTDRTREIAESHAARRRADTAYHVIESSPGLIEAQRAIARLASAPDFLIFVDADCVLDEQCLRELVAAMTDRPQTQAAWATRVLVTSQPRGVWQAILNFGDYHRDVVRRGHYIVGQAFAIRRYDVPYGSTHGPATDPRLRRYLQLERGPMSDDAFLSRSLISRYGPESLHHASAAVVYCQPMSSIRDLYRSQRRKAYEVLRLDLLFPEMRTIRGRFFGRRIDDAAYARLSPAERWQCRVYTVLYSGLWRFAQFQLAFALRMLRWGVPLRPCNVWPVVEGTKKPFAI